MDDTVKAYLPEASAFIFVINSANAGGLQKDRVEKLIKHARQVSLDKQRESSSNCALFVCNKWDCIPSKMIDEVKNHTVRKLAQCWPSLDPESQIIHMSAKHASEAQKFGVITEEFGELMNGIKSMVLKSVERRLQIQWRLRDAVSKEIQMFFTNKTDNVAFSVLTEAKKEDDNKRATLLNFYERTDVGLNTLEGKALALLDKTIGNFKEKIVTHKQNLKKEEFTVFVVGETSSGKSTLLNLILGEQLLPCSFLSTTSTICELRYGDTPILVAHLTDKESGFTVFLDELPEASEISEFVSVKESKYRERGSDLEKIELLWSHNLLKENVVLVDSPSSGESAIMDDMVKSYLPEAVAIIFVINVANAGGLRREMLENVIEYTRQVSLDTQRESFSKCALFVCNKWDQVPSEETDKVKNTIERKLTECLPGLDLESQIIYMSAKDASKEEFTELMNGIESMVLKTIEARLQIQWRWLYHLLSRIVSQTNKFIRDSRNDFFKPLHRMSVNLRNEMAVFGIKEAPIMDISCDDLEWQENAVIGSGAFASVYRGTLKVEEGVQPLRVALKVWKEELNEATACGFLSETETLRKLNHQFIVKFYGTALHKEGDRLRTILVMELCTENLRSHIFRHKSKVPGQSSTPTAARNVIGWAKDIADALKYIHRQGIVHRDLKLENILLSQENVVKVADVGVSKEARAITGTRVGTPLYLAPEVINSIRYDYKADIYSFGIMLWEMWYGKRALLDVARDEHELFDVVIGGTRPLHAQGSNTPPAALQNVMRRCWDKNPNKRPDSAQCYQELSELFKKV